MTGSVSAARLVQRVPFFYGWVVLACVCFAGFSRAGPSVATLSVFVEPMTREFGWSRTSISGAVSVGGVLAALTSPLIGSILDRHGPRLILCIAVLTTGISIMALSLTPSLLGFYLMFCIGRLNFAGPFDLGIYGAVNNWFVARRAFATSIANLAQMTGLVLIPLIGHFATLHYGWRVGWIAIGAAVLVVGFLPAWILMIRKPEDVGLVPDQQNVPVKAGDEGKAAAVPALPPEPVFTRNEALRTSAFWLLTIFTLIVYPVQAGVSLHQAAHLIERGMTPTVAATVVSVFSFVSAVSGFAFAMLGARLGVRLSLFFVGAFLAAGATAMTMIATSVHAYAAGAVFGFGIGGLLTVLPIAWADYFGRRNFGAIRGVALSVQVVAQASGPMISGVLRDWSGDYVLSLRTLAGMALTGAVIALVSRPPKFATGRA